MERSPFRQYYPADPDGPLPGYRASIGWDIVDPTEKGRVYAAIVEEYQLGMRESLIHCVIILGMICVAGNMLSVVGIHEVWIGVLFARSAGMKGNLVTAELKQWSSDADYAASEVIRSFNNEK